MLSYLKCPKKKKSNKIHKATFLQTLDIRQWRTVILERQKGNEVSAIALREFRSHSVGGAAKAEPWESCEIEEEELRFQRKQETRLPKTWELHREKEMQRDIWSVLRITHQSKCMRNHSSLRIHIGRENTSQHSHKDGLNAYSQKAGPEKLIIQSTE